MIYEIILDSLDVELVLNALDEKAWNARTTATISLSPS